MQRTIDYKNELNEAQLDAVTSTEGPHLVIAGAGSGKTRVLVFRTAYLVEGGVPPEEILLLTFTRRASQEMLERSTAILDDRCHQVAGGTFHSFANMMLRRHGSPLGITPGFTILDQSDSEGAVNLVRTQLGYNKADKRFPKKSTLLSVISKSVNKCCDVEDVVYEEYPHFMEYVPAINQIKEGYVQYKKSLRCLDYDDLLVFLRDLLAQYPAVCQRLSEHYRYIMVDEYQDTNKIQAEIVQLLATSHTNVMVVGDDSQSIYSFRGAHFKNIIEFPRIFPGTKVIILEENYRSSQPILDLTNEVINSAREKFEKILFTNNKGKNLPVYIDTPDENAQSRYIVDKIITLLAQGVKLNEIAVLFRSGWHSNDLEVELSSHGIPFRKYGGQKFVESAHIKDTLSFLNIVHNPYHELSWLRVLTFLPGVGAKSAQQISQSIIKNKGKIDATDKLIQRKKEVQQLVEKIGRINAFQSPRETIKQIVEIYYPYLMDQYDDFDKRTNDLASLENISARYDTLEDFLTDMALEPPEKNLITTKTDRDDHSNLVLSTIHSAKGLEWHTVFVIYVAEGYLPSYRSFENGNSIEEERRLFYVAATRAKQNLFLIRPQIDRSGRGRMDPNSSMFTRVSRFLGEGEILNKLVQYEGQRHSYNPSWDQMI